MTEQEAINILKSDSCYECTYGQNSPVDCVYGACRVSKAVKIAINSLEEIQQYRAIGTPNQIYIRMGGYIEELSKYAAIGTPEECRAAVEKQRAKKPRLCMNEVSGMFVDYADGHGEYKKQMNNWWRCPCCNSVVGQRVIVHGRTHDQRKKKFCEDCGTKVDWS